MIPVRFFFDGDEEKANSLVGLGKRVLSNLNTFMSFQDLKVGSKVIELHDGSIIVASVNYGVSHVHIFSPLKSHQGKLECGEAVLKRIHSIRENTFVVEYNGKEYVAKCIIPPDIEYDSSDVYPYSRSVLKAVIAGGTDVSVWDGNEFPDDSILASQPTCKVVCRGGVPKEVVEITSHVSSDNSLINNSGFPSYFPLILVRSKFYNYNRNVIHSRVALVDYHTGEVARVPNDTFTEIIDAIFDDMESVKYLFTEGNTLLLRNRAAVSEYNVDFSWISSDWDNGAVMGNGLRPATVYTNCDNALIQYDMSMAVIECPDFYPGTTEFVVLYDGTPICFTSCQYNATYSIDEGGDIWSDYDAYISYGMYEVIESCGAIEYGAKLCGNDLSIFGEDIYPPPCLPVPGENECVYNDHIGGGITAFGAGIDIYHINKVYYLTEMCKRVVPFVGFGGVASGSFMLGSNEYTFTLITHMSDTMMRFSDGDELCGYGGSVVCQVFSRELEVNGSITKDEVVTYRNNSSHYTYTQSEAVSGINSYFDSCICQRPIMDVNWGPNLPDSEGIGITEYRGMNVPYYTRTMYTPADDCGYRVDITSKVLTYLVPEFFIEVLPDNTYTGGFVKVFDINFKTMYSNVYYFSEAVIRSLGGEIGCKYVDFFDNPNDLNDYFPYHVIDFSPDLSDGYIDNHFSSFSDTLKLAIGSHVDGLLHTMFGDLKNTCTSSNFDVDFVFIPFDERFEQLYKNEYTG